MDTTAIRVIPRSTRERKESYEADVMAVQKTISIGDINGAQRCCKRALEIDANYPEARDLMLAEYTGGRIHVAHVSTASSASGSIRFSTCATSPSSC